MNQDESVILSVRKSAGETRHAVKIACESKEALKTAVTCALTAAAQSLLKRGESKESAATLIIEVTYGALHKAGCYDAFREIVLRGTQECEEMK